MILFKRRQFIKEPLRMLGKALFGTGRSSTFLGVFVLIYQSMLPETFFCNIVLMQLEKAYFCMKHNLHAYLMSPASSIKLPGRVVDLLIGKMSFWLGGLLSGISLFIEAKHRRPELAMYVLPKGLESVWRMARGKGMVIGPKKYGECLVCVFFWAYLCLYDIVGLNFGVLSALCSWDGDGYGECMTLFFTCFDPLLSWENFNQNAYQVSTVAMWHDMLVFLLRDVHTA
jgi:hypothetical protein